MHSIPPESIPTTTFVASDLKCNHFSDYETKSSETVLVLQDSIGKKTYEIFLTHSATMITVHLLQPYGSTSSCIHQDVVECIPLQNEMTAPAVSRVSKCARIGPYATSSLAALGALSKQMVANISEDVGTSWMGISCRMRLPPEGWASSQDVGRVTMAWGMS
jgi:hypothetical protein